MQKDYAEAAKWYRRAADQGDIIAVFNLGGLNENGRGVPQDYAEAVRLYQIAADAGNADAQYNLGRMYGLGQGVPQNYVIAHMWFNLAAVQGAPDAVGLRDGIAKLMTPTQIAQAQKLAREWRAVSPLPR